MTEDKVITDVDVIEEIRKALPLADAEKSGLSERCMNPTVYSVDPLQSIDIRLDIYGIYIFVSEQFAGTSLLFQKAYSVANFKIILDVSNIIGNYYKIEQIADDSDIIRVTSLEKLHVQRFSINRL